MAEVEEKQPERPADWSDEQWDEYLAWWDGLLEHTEGDDVAHLVVVGKGEEKAE